MDARPLPGCAGKLPFEGSSNLSDFCQHVHLPRYSAAGRHREALTARAAINNLARYLKRPARIDDLTAATAAAFCLWMSDRGRSANTLDDCRETLQRMARAAVAEGIINSAGALCSFLVVPGRRKKYAGVRSTPPWSIEELNRLYGSARTMPGSVFGIPARVWWPALILSVLDTQVAAPQLMMLPPSAFDDTSSTLRADLFIYKLSDRTSAALRALGHAKGSRLFPWDADGGRPPFFMLYYHYREVLDRAALPARNSDLFSRLIATAAAADNVTDAIDLDAPFVPREWPARQPRRRDPSKPATRAPSLAAAPYGFRETRPHSTKRPKSKMPRLYRVAASPDRAHRTFRHFFENVYVPRRLDAGSGSSAGAYRATVNRLCEFAVCEVILDQLSDDLVERFLVWLRKCGYSPHSRKRMRGELLSIWRYAWRKRDPQTGKPFLEEPPRDIDPVAVPKMQPECWSIEEVGRLVTVAAATTGCVCGIPANLYWPALILLIYDTGLRIRAVMSLKVADVDLQGGWLKARFDTQKQRADQSLPLFAQTVQLLAATKPETREALFPWPFRDRRFPALRKRLRLLLQRAGLPSGKRDLFHKLRRTNGTYVADAAGEETAMRQLGHSAIQVTRGYIDVRKLSAPRVVDSMRRPEWHFAGPEFDARAELISDLMSSPLRLTSEAQ